MVLQDMREKTAGDKGSELILSLDEATGFNDDVYVVHYDMSDIGELWLAIQPKSLKINEG